jgi:hypothetical protein
MPIDYKRYPVAWKRISRLIRFRRAQNRCEWCGAENGLPHPVTGSRVVLTVAHLGEPYAAGADKHDKLDIRAENLLAMCQACHLRFDLADHIRHRRENRELQRQKCEPLLFP